MKYLTILFIFSALCLSAFSQEMTKEEKKKVKKELKNYIKNPESYVKKVDSYETSISDLESEVENKTTVIESQEITITELNADVNALKTDLADKDATISSLQETACDEFPEGSTYRVQIGLYQNFNISEYFDAIKFVLFEDVEGLSRYSVGNFKDVNEAIDVKQDFKKMGIKDAFVTEYVNGVRNTEFSEEQIVK